MTAYPKTKPYRNQRYLDWLKTQPSCAPQNRRDQRGEIVYAHQRAIGWHCGKVKPHDTYALPITVYEHEREHHGDKSFWQDIVRAMLCVFHVAKYLETKNIDGWKFILDAVTEKMEREKLK